MLKIYDPWEGRYHSFQRKNADPHVYQYASELSEQLGFDDPEELVTALRRAWKVCDALDIPIEDNFKRVYRFSRNTLINDWKLSSLGCYLIVINANPENPHVARAQLYFTVHKRS